MANKQQKDLLNFDGRTGEGGGQLVRIAAGLASLTGTAIQIDNVRGNREGKRGGGLKAQHESCITTLAAATSAITKTAFIGSKSFTYKPILSPSQLLNRTIQVKSNSAASILLVLQSLLPFLVFAGGSPITLNIQGGTNVSFSVSYEYADQVLLPALERFGIKVERKMQIRGWATGPYSVGLAKFTIFPIPLGETLKAPKWPAEQGSVTKINVSLLCPKDLQGPLQNILVFELGLVFPDVEVNFVLVEDSRHAARIYTLLVAHTTTGLRFGRDCLYNKSVKFKTDDEIATEISQKVVDELDVEIRRRGLVDEHLQDQLVVYQALAQGRSSVFSSKAEKMMDEKGVEKADRTDEPWGDGTMHSKTARWVTAQLLPGAKWFHGGKVCEGVGWKAGSVEVESVTKKLEELGVS